jgi:DNA-binding MurR/RpiR family transcriptional regulator
MSGFSDAASQMNLNEVAKRAGVSTATVSRVLNHASVVRTPPVCA